MKSRWEHVIMEGGPTFAVCVIHMYPFDKPNPMECKGETLIMEKKAWEQEASSSIPTQCMDSFLLMQLNTKIEPEKRNIWFIHPQCPSFLATFAHERECPTVTMQITAPFWSLSIFALWMHMLVQFQNPKFVWVHETCCHPHALL